MDAKLFTRMLGDQHFLNLEKLQYKYSRESVNEMLGILNESMYVHLPLHDFNGKPMVYLDSVARVRMQAVKLLLSPQNIDETYGIQAMGDEIHSTLEIENIHTSRDSVKRILEGYAPANESENRILGMKKGLEFISDPSNPITEENLSVLYGLTVGDFLEEDDRLLPGNLYRHDKVYIVGSRVFGEGIDHRKLPEYMRELIRFIDKETEMDDLLKAALIHFYIGYLHPYFDGNGRTARLIHLWYLVQKGYSSALFVPFSSYINESRSSYYKAYRLVTENAKISGLNDVTPFLVYFIENIYNKMSQSGPSKNALDRFAALLNQGQVTEKEKKLWNFVLSAYGTNEFSTKQLERDFGEAAYGTIRKFVQKFETFGILAVTNYPGRPKYRIL